MKLYHASPAAGLTVLQPSVSMYFAEKPKQVCLTKLRAMALLYGIKHFEYTYGYAKDGRIFYEEYFPNALEELYRGKQASLYVCSWTDGMETTNIPNEVVSKTPVPVEEEISIPDVLQALLEENNAGRLTVVRWDELSRRTRDWVDRVQMEEILGADLLNQDSPRARYMQEKYPISWAMALKEWEASP